VKKVDTAASTRRRRAHDHVAELADGGYACTFLMSSWTNSAHVPRQDRDAPITLMAFTPRARSRSPS